ncbi:MAG: trigger factor [Micrococcales bacterium 73-15]|uniref:trigger factor n=1 Tax=Salana multivorans TaxID=120377 RepID=UPI00095C8A4A|nr:trigger factor [Salana multivorans]OJX95736.1 MAG: trigger factor [Micrococcales bacterium 73-15]
MKSAVETLEPTRVRLTVEVPYSELLPNIEHAYQHIGKDVSIPGFRKGKVPARIIDQRIGFGAVLEHAINDALPQFYREALVANEIIPLGQPEVDVTEAPVERTGDLVFTAEVDVRPEITVPEIDGLRVEVAPVDVTDEELDARIEALRHRFGSLQGVEREAAQGDYVVLDLVAKIGEEEVDSVSGISYEIGSGTMLDGLDEAVVGLGEGGTATFATSLAGGERAGEEAEVTVTVTGVKELELPELDDEFAQLASEFDTLEELKDDLRTSAAGGKVEQQAVEAREQLMTKLVESADFPVPASVVEAEVVRHLEGEDRLEDTEHREEIVPEITDALRRQFLLDVLAEQLEVKVSQEELIDFLVRMAQQYRVDPNEFVMNADRTGQIPVFVAELARNKALALALRKVEVVDTTGASVDLTPFIGSDELDAVQAAAVAAAQEAADAEDAGDLATEVAVDAAAVPHEETVDEAGDVEASVAEQAEVVVEKPKKATKAKAATAPAPTED